MKDSGKNLWVAADEVTVWNSGGDIAAQEVVSSQYTGGTWWQYIEHIGVHFTDLNSLLTVDDSAGTYHDHADETDTHIYIYTHTHTPPLPVNNKCDAAQDDSRLKNNFQQPTNKLTWPFW